MSKVFHWRFTICLSTIAASAKELPVACPFFMPTNRFDDGGWIHPSRLPLGAGWKGQCCAPGHTVEQPSDDQLRELCNLGYSHQCPRLPKERSCDAVRFGVARDRGTQVSLSVIFETGHRPAGRDAVEYDTSSHTWTSCHPDERIQRMASCFMESYLLRRIQSSPTGSDQTKVND